MAEPNYPEAAVGGWQEITMRFWFEPNVDAAPENWAFEEMLGNEVRIVYSQNVELLDEDGNEVPNPEAPSGTNWERAQALKSALEHDGLVVTVWSPDDVIHLWGDEDGEDQYFDKTAPPTYEEALAVLADLKNSLDGAQIDRGWEVLQQLAEDSLMKVRKEARDGVKD